MFRHWKSYFPDTWAFRGIICLKYLQRTRDEQYCLEYLNSVSHCLPCEMKSRAFIFGLRGKLQCLTKGFETTNEFSEERLMKITTKLGAANSLPLSFESQAFLSSIFLTVGPPKGDTSRLPHCIYIDENLTASLQRSFLQICLLKAVNSCCSYFVLLNAEWMKLIKKCENDPNMMMRTRLFV